ncbi:hypothetical protein ABEV34_26805 [Methylorubrum rhodesianum]|uniref:hypothetical protein n=1 Tax=Methylorubrum TaxID=2282523 RepID=UPI00160E0384|nr:MULTISPECIES: hypothetical protein [Methylorubrum]MBB5765934.1 hypothetical protein [Methylorubrum rhodesianum]MBI1691576.1 hypothetical protein [Methylorubrum sp. DB1722]
MADILVPGKLTPELIEILGMPNFQSAPIARAFRASGRAEIKSRFEDEQAFVLHWLLGLHAEHGTAWREAASKVLEAVIAEAKARAAEGAGGARG